MDRTRIVIVSSDPLTRGGLAALAASRDDLALAAQGAPADAPRLAAEHPGAVVLFDLAEGASALAHAERAAAVAPVVALTADPPGAADALRAGARGVLLRGAGPDALAAAVLAAGRGLSVLDPALADAFLHPPEGAEGAEPLTAREREVLALLAEGLANKAIAARLGISEHTAKFHVNAILAKLGAGSRAEAIVRAARRGLVVL